MREMINKLLEKEEKTRVLRVVGKWNSFTRSLLNKNDN